jgi:hypothetical protein
VICTWLDRLVGFEAVFKLARGMLAVLGEANTTAVRIWVTIAAFAATTASYLALAARALLLAPAGTTPTFWVPAIEWMLFLGGMAGIDVVQWGFKRQTHKPELAAGSGPVITLPQGTRLEGWTP